MRKMVKYNSHETSSGMLAVTLAVEDAQSVSSSWLLITKLEKLTGNRQNKQYFN